MKILITGSDGFLGRKLFNTLSLEHEVYGTHRQDAKDKIFSLDITNNKKASELSSTIKPDILVHTAALVDIEKCEKEKELAYKINTEATQNLAGICKKLRIKMIYISTDYVFSDREKAYSINSQPDPINYYGETKLLGEDAIRNILDDYVVIRPTILYGFNSSEDKKNFVLNVVNKLSNNEGLTLDNKRIKYPLLIDDLAKIIDKLIKSKGTGIYHVSGPDAVTKYSWGRTIAKIFRLPEERVIGKSLNETNRPYNVRFDESYEEGNILNLENGLKLIKNQIEKARL